MLFRSAVIALAGAIVGVAVSLARAAALGFAIASVIALSPRFRPPRMGRRVATLSASILVVAGFLLLGYILTGSTGFLVERYVFESVDDPTAAGRAGGYSAWFATLTSLSPGDLLQTLSFGDWATDPVEDALEGVPAVVALYGVFSLTAMGAIILLPCRMIRESIGSEGTILWFGLVASAAMWTVDNTLLFPPTFMNWFLLAGLAVQIARTRAEARATADSERVGLASILARSGLESVS